LESKFDLAAARHHADTGGLMNTTKWLHAALDEIEQQAARIKELEEANRNIDKRRDEMAAFIERLEAAFLKARQCPTCKGEGTIHPIGQPIDSICPKCLGDPESMAREALERIKAETGSGDHVAGANKLILTAEQREEEGKRNA